MSGTSLDGVDVAIIQISGNGKNSKIKKIGFQFFPYSQKFTNFVLKNSNSNTAKLDEISSLNFLFAKIFSNCVKKTLKKFNIENSQVDFIGSHGQTIQHIPNGKKILNSNVNSTFQIGDPSVIAKLTSILTVGDFRVSDVALNGSGAPLVPYFDYCFFSSQKKNRMLLNIGGIANITLLPKNCNEKNIIAFDTGCGNMMVDLLVNKFYNKSFDKDGTIASRGNINYDLLNLMQEHSYFKKAIPKSTGREKFGETFVEKILYHSKKIKREDIVTTATYFTVWGIYFHIHKFISNKNFPEEIIISGGGSHNKTMMKFLSQIFPNSKIFPIDKFGISANEKEAIAFAFLANETLSNIASNIPSVTKARKSTTLGKICLP